MSTKRITSKITTALWFIMITVIIVACNNEQGMMHGSSSMGMSNWNWVQILTSLGLGLILGFIIGTIVSKRK